jgi:hypothetical protein
MSERKGSRWTHFLMMLPFFLIGIALPVYFFGFTGEGGAGNVETESFNPAPSDGGPAERSFSFDRRPGVVAFAQDMFDLVERNLAPPELSPTTIKIGVLFALFAGGFFVLRLILALIAGTLGGLMSFLVHKAAGPMFMGFLAVGSTWGIHQTIAQEFGLSWAAATVSMTAAVATLFALAGVRLRG